MDQYSEQIGERISDQRRKRGMTLDELAAETGFTKSYLSKIENSRKIPPIGSLARICRALDAELASLFEETGKGEEERDDFISLVRSHERQPVIRGGTSFGYDYQSLAHEFHNKHMDPFLFTFPNDIADEVFFEHEGEEFIFVICGRIRFTVGNREWILEPGDSLYFDAAQPHRGEALGQEAKALIVIYTPPKSETGGSRRGMPEGERRSIETAETLAEVGAVHGSASEDTEQ